MKKLLLIVAVVRLCGADAEPRWVTLNHTAREAVQAKDYAKLRETLLELRPLLPGNPRILYNLAASEAHLGNTEAALEVMRDLAGAGLVYDFNADEDFAGLRGSPAFESILNRVELNRKPVGGAAAVSPISEPDLLPEDLAYDEKAKRFLIGSITQCKIVTPDGKLFAKSDWPVMALRIDTRRHLLWAATGWIANCRQCNAADKDKSAVLAFDLDSGKQVKRVDSPVPGLLGDMTIGRSGDLYVSEGLHGAVLRLQANAVALERLDRPGEFRSPQTPALSPDERTLYVPDYVRGVAALDLKARAVRWLQPAGDVVLSGIDGFYWYRGSFIAVQNGVNLERIVRFSSDLKKQEILERATPGLGEATHGTLAGDRFYFIANTGWDTYEDDGKKKAGGSPVVSEIRKIELRKGLR